MAVGHGVADRVGGALPSGEVQQHHEPGGALDQGPDRAAPSLPMIRSPSQCPGTARSSTSAGRSLIITMSGICPRRSVRPWGLAHGAAGAQARASSGAAHRGPARTATCRSSRATPASPDRRGNPARSRPAICCGDHNRSRSSITRAHNRGFAPNLVGLRASGLSARARRCAATGPYPCRPPWAAHLPRDRRRRPPHRRRSPANDSPRLEPDPDLDPLIERQPRRRRRPHLGADHPTQGRNAFQTVPSATSRLQPDLLHGKPLGRQPDDLMPHRDRQHLATRFLLTTTSEIAYPDTRTTIPLQRPLETAGS